MAAPAAPAPLVLRYSVGYGPAPFDVVVNGASRAVVLPQIGNSPQWRHTNWEILRLEDIEWLAGAANTVEVVATAGVNASLDDLVVTTADHLALAAPHRRVLDLTPAAQDQLIAFLLQLDAQGGAGPGPFFGDGFESGDTAAWQ